MLAGKREIFMRKYYMDTKTDAIYRNWKRLLRVCQSCNINQGIDGYEDVKWTGTGRGRGPGIERVI